MVDAICDTRPNAGWHRTRFSEPMQKYGSDLFGCHSPAPLDQIFGLGIVLVLRGARAREPDRVLTVHNLAYSKEACVGCAGRSTMVAWQRVALSRLRRRRSRSG
jgi:hypothetical protein